MISLHWLRRLQRRLFPAQAQKALKARRRPPASRRVRLSLEGLEERLTPSTTINPIANNTPAISGPISPDAASATTTAASDATATFSPSDQNVTLKASVTSSAGTVKEGSVQFTILQGTTVIGTATSGTVSDGSASVSYKLPGGTAAGTYTIEADYSDSSGTFASSSDNTHTLTVSAASTTTAASNVTVAFSSSAQNATLKASVTSTAGTVDEGSVKFTILQGTTVIGTALSGTVSGGSASVSYALPAGQALGTYTIEADYTDSSKNFADSSDKTHTLTIATATTTTAKSATTTFNESDRTVTLTATVTSSGTAATVGSVAFTLLDSSGNTIGSSLSGTVNSSGQASVSYIVPAGTAAGSYTIEADYSDSTGKFAPSSDNTHKLTINAAATTITASNATVSFNSSAQNVTLSATVTSSAGSVNEGSVAFTIFDSSGNTVGTSTSGTVNNGSVSVSFALPAGLAAGSYTIEADYSDSTGNFAANSDISHTLTVSAASGTSVTLTAVNIVPNASGTSAQVTFTATVSNASGTVGAGVLSITMAGVSGQGNVVNGTATVQLTVPLQAVANNANLTLSYSDNAAAANFAGQTQSQSLAFNIWNATLPSNLSFANDGSEVIQVQMSGQAMFGWVYSASGLLEQINVSSLTLPVTYTHVGGQELATIAGVPWQLMMSSNGQSLGIASLGFNTDGSAEVFFFDPNGQIIGAQPL
jgi:hypothetical protein